eukprot:Gregarina_sp_Poly_1__8412@NODE_494_length_7954_cov_165_977304_g228_i1_p2_GENE_NODE_494_length_7954_cov_165_977304_g228_i1NODE_494_length_7954_cov_165_977304_g228_i1_p2_ORF_typecomplete_len286_score27_90_NODE_494_length_7954_cov_165_977304_g228_i119502807
MPEDPSGFDLWEVAQLKGCMVSVCANDYIKKTIPGCLDPNGNIVLVSPEHSKPLAVHKPGSFGDFDYYDPGRLEFWHGVGFFTLHRLWYNIRHGEGLFRMVILPGTVLVLLSLPILLLALIVPGMTAEISDENPPPPPSPRRSRPHMAMTASDYDNYGSIVNPSVIHLCDSTFTRSKLLSNLKAIVDGLTKVSDIVSTTATYIYSRGAELLGKTYRSSAAHLGPLSLELTSTRPRYSPIPSSEIVPAEDPEREKRLPGTSTTLPSTGKTLPSPPPEGRDWKIVRS